MPIISTRIRRTAYSLVYDVTGNDGAPLVIPTATLVADAVLNPMKALIQTPVLTGDAVERLQGQDYLTLGDYFANPEILYLEITVLPLTSAGGDTPWYARLRRNVAANRAELSIVHIAGDAGSNAEVRLQVRHTFDR